MATDSSEAEAEVEIESEAEASVYSGSAVAAGGTSISVGAAGNQAYLASDGSTHPVKAETLTAVDAQTSTSSSVAGDTTDGATSIGKNATGDFSEPLFGRDQNIEQPTQSTLGFDPYAVLDSETEVEVESEAEVWNDVF